MFAVVEALRLGPSGRAGIRNRTISPRVRALDPRALRAELPLAVTGSVLEGIRRTVGAIPAESGGVLGGSRASGLVSEFIPDTTARVTGTTYTPDTTLINQIIREQWKPRGLEFMGFVHSHPSGCLRPSAGDSAYAARILDALGWLDAMAMPIVGSRADSGRFSLKAFHAVRAKDKRVSRIVPGPFVVVPPRPSTATHPYLERVRTAYDPAVMSSTRIVALGTGGSASYLEDMARSGIGEFVLVDPDRVEAVNIGTQHTWPSAVGTLKVESLAQRLAELHPAARVWTIAARDGELDDQVFGRLVRGHLPGGSAQLPALSLLCGFTDSFVAQARLSRLALQLAVPYLSAAVYREGLGVEVVFSAPGVTTACARCAQARRYQAYLEGGYVNTVTSHGTPILATSRLNALKQLVTLALLHGLNPLADAGHPATERYGRALSRIAERNLVVTRLDPEIGAELGLVMFDGMTAVSEGRCVFDDTLWIKQSPDRPDNGFPHCPDCGGTGDLWGTRGRFVDTRLMPRTFGEGRRP